MDDKTMGKIEKKKFPFYPTFGSRPAQLVGRDRVIDDFMGGLSYDSGHPYRASIFTGQRGMGKTALLLELSERAREADYISARTLAGDNMLDAIIEGIQNEGEKYLAQKMRKVTGINIGAYGFSAGLTFNDATEKTFGFGVKLSMLLDELAKHGKGVLVLVDEVQASGPAIRELAEAFQTLVGDGKDLAITFAGLPEAISSVLNDELLTFLNRAHKVELAGIDISEFSKYYYKSFKALDKQISPDVLRVASKATKGYPYLFQLIGFHILGYLGESADINDEIVALAVQDAKNQLVSNVYIPSLKHVSVKDMSFLKAMAGSGTSAKMSDIVNRLGVSASYAQQYRLRMLEAGLVRSAGHGLLEFVLPYMDEYLRGAMA